MLGSIKQYQRYSNILGYYRNIFFIYDSMQKPDKNKNNNLTIDKNDDLPGNMNISERELLNFWRKGGK